VCVKFGWKIASGYRNFSKTAQGVILWDTCGSSTLAFGGARGLTVLTD